MGQVHLQRHVGEEGEMAIEVRIPKEITEYQEKILFGLSLRQLISFAIALTTGVTTYLLAAKLWGEDLAGYIVIVEVMPIFAIGFIRINGFTFEKYLSLMIRHMFGYSRRRYQTQLLIDEMVTCNMAKGKVRRQENAGAKKTGTRKVVRECCDVEITAKSRKRTRKTAIREIAAARKEYRAAERAAKKEERKGGGSQELATNHPVQADV